MAFLIVPVPVDIIWKKWGGGRKARRGRGERLELEADEKEGRERTGVGGRLDGVSLSKLVLD
jgi:hypothetical protein